jgi:rRNA maturation protein Nop10
LEASPSYLYGKERIAEAIKKVLQDARIIVILRDPTDRLESYFSRAVSKSTLPGDINFSDYVTLSEMHVNSNEQSVYARGLREGMYINYVPAWQSIFGANFRIVFFDDLKNDAYSLTAGICRWLGLDVADCAPEKFSVENRTLQYRFKKLHRYVKDFYMKNELFWRRHHRLKQHLRGIYNRFNADATVRLQSIDETTVSRLRNFYEPYNNQLKTFLEANGYNTIPAWLNPRSCPDLTQSSSRESMD